MNLIPLVISLWIAAIGTTFALVREHAAMPKPYLVSYMSRTLDGGFAVGSATLNIRVADANMENVREKCAELLAENNAKENQPAPIGIPAILSIVRL